MKKKQTSLTKGGITGKGFVKGKSGNAGGRPKWKHITETLKQEHNLIKVEVMIDKVFEMAMQGNMRAVEFIADRLEGKARQYFDVQMDNSNDWDKPIKVFDIPGIDDEIGNS